ncbi:MAG TPA: hypothetical protein VIE36_22020 [Methylomirabilota bacterium]|jgi:hypothetical protein
MPRKIRGQRKAETTPPDEEHREPGGPNLGYEDDAGHAGGTQPLDAKSETESDH